MKRLLFLALAALLVATNQRPVAAADAEAEGMQPMILIAHKGYGELMRDMDFMGSVTGNEDLGDGIEGMLDLLTGGASLEEVLDKDRPWGLSVGTDGIELQILAFLPVNDLPKFLEIIGSVGGGANDEGDGLYRFDVIGQSLYIKQKGKWTYASISPDFLKELPDDALTLLKGAELKHDFIAKIKVENIPEVFRQLATAPIQQQFQGMLERLPGGQTESSTLDLRGMIMDRIFDSITISMNDVSLADFGGSIDAEKRLGIFDYTVTPIADSDMAKKQALTAKKKTRFAGFMVPDATAAFNIHMELTQADTLQFTEFVSELRGQILEQVGNINAIPDGEVKDQVKEIFNHLINSLDNVAKEGKVNAGIALVGEGPFTLVAGAETNTPEELQKFAEGMSNLLENQLGFYGFQLNAAKHKDVTFHTVAIPLPGGDVADQLIELFGFDLELTFAVGEKSIYVAMGADGVEILKKIIDKSAEMADSDLPPLQVKMNVAPLFEIMAKGPNVNPSIAGVITGIEKGKDQLTIVTKNVPNGMHTHVEMQEGLLKVIGAMMSQFGPNMLPQLQ